MVMVPAVIVMAMFCFMCMVFTLFNMVVISSMMSWMMVVRVGELMVGASAKIPRKQIAPHLTNCQQDHQPL